MPHLEVLLNELKRQCLLLQRLVILKAYLRWSEYSDNSTISIKIHILMSEFTQQRIMHCSGTYFSKGLKVLLMKATSSMLMRPFLKNTQDNRLSSDLWHQSITAISIMMGGFVTPSSIGIILPVWLYERYWTTSSRCSWLLSRKIRLITKEPSNSSQIKIFTTLMWGSSARRMLSQVWLRLRMFF